MFLLQRHQILKITPDGVDLHIGEVFSTDLRRLHLPELGCRTWMVHRSHITHSNPADGNDQDPWIKWFTCSGKTFTCTNENM